MTDRVKNLLLIVVSITALALGGSAIAGAASGGGGSSSSQSTPSARPQAPARHPPNGAGLPPQRPGETLLTGDTAANVRAAALAKVSGGTIERVETDVDGHAAYEAHMTRSDGSRVTVYVDKSFDVVAVESGP
jgi:hypothetical protein